MGILSWIILGLIAGVIAKAIHPSKDPGGWLTTILLGILGAFVGGWIGSLLKLGTINDISFRTILLAIGGSILLLWLYRFLRRR